MMELLTDPQVVANGKRLRLQPGGGGAERLDRPPLPLSRTLF